MNLQDKLKILRSLRNEAPQKWVSDQMGITVAAYSKMESGQTDLNYSRLEQLSAIYGMTVAQLLDPACDPLKFYTQMQIRWESKERLFAREQQAIDLRFKLIQLLEKA
jgi:transcriptional regulator with XRE-family HTH domain